MNNIRSLSDNSGLLLIAAQFQSIRSGVSPILSEAESRPQDGFANTSPITGAVKGSPSFTFVGHVVQNSVGASLTESEVASGIPLNDYDIANQDWMQSLATNFVADNSMTSQQISHVLYSGGAIESGAGNNTFADEVSGLQNGANAFTKTAALITQWVAQGMPDGDYKGLNTTSFNNMTVDQVTNLAAQYTAKADSLTQEASQLQTAFDNHTLMFQKATDVQGLDYSETVTGISSGMGGTVGVTESYNQNFMNQDADGKSHDLVTFGDVQVYLTW